MPARLHFTKFIWQLLSWQSSAAMSIMWTCRRVDHQWKRLEFCNGATIKMQQKCLLLLKMLTTCFIFVHNSLQTVL